MENKTLPTSVLVHISKLLNIPLMGLVTVIGLIQDGGTVPFIARYRKEATGNLDEVQIQAIQEKLEYFTELEDRRATVLSSIQNYYAVDDLQTTMHFFITNKKAIPRFTSSGQYCHRTIEI